ncbi:MAG: hypothetical protein JNL02_18045 [Saprospiraceae bacterium]|nr:hypothetical protein [Saprospiraceae bacterium]
MKPWNDWKFVLLACLTLGMAPFAPEPHVLGKIRWVAGGAIGMQPMDWFDLVMHGTPWVLLIRVLILHLAGRLKTE